MEAFEGAWTPLVLLAGIVLVAFLVREIAPEKRHHVRRAAVLFGLYVAVQAASMVAAQLSTGRAPRVLHVIAQILEAFSVVNLLAISIFDLALPAVKIRVVSITSDLAVGISYAIATIGILGSAGMDLSSMVATSAVVSGIIALSLQATLGNILGGIALHLDGSIHVGDWVQLTNGRQGKVKAIRWRHTVLETRDWDTIVVPNASLLASEIIILGKREGQPVVQHRMSLNFGVDHRFPPQKVIETVNAALRASPFEGIAAEPPPHCLLHDLAKDGRDSFGYYLVRYWLIDIDRDDLANSRVRTRVISALERAGIPLARPETTVFLARDAEIGKERRAAHGVERRLNAIASLELFDRLPTEQQRILADHLRYAPFNAGEVIMRAGEKAEWMYILVSGKVEIRTGASNGDAGRVVATLEGPTFFGEMGLMTGEPRSADVVAATEAETYLLHRTGFELVILPHPEIAQQVSETLARRRVGLLAAREGLDEDAKKVRQASEQERILGRIKEFFGLDLQG